jgi:hypothetical protein
MTRQHRRQHDLAATSRYSQRRLSSAIAIMTQQRHHANVIASMTRQRRCQYDLTVISHHNQRRLGSLSPA